MDNRLCFYFGKLPAFGDFVRYHASGKEALDFDQWLQEGIYAARMQLNKTWDTAFENAPVNYFHFYLDPQYFLIGIWKPSRDKAGRNFPFVLAAKVAWQQNTDNSQIHPVFLANFYTKATLIMNDAIEGSDLEEVNRCVDNLSFDLMNNSLSLRAQYQEYVANTTLDHFWSQLWGIREDGKKYVLMANLVDILLPLRGQDVTNISLGLKFPVSESHEILNFNVRFWLDVISCLSGNLLAKSYYFWSPPGEKYAAKFQFFFRLPSAKSFITFVKTDIDNDFVCELDKEGIEMIDKRMESLSAQYRSILEKSNITLKEFLQMI